VAKQQAVERDIAVVVNEKATHAQLMQAVEAAQTGGLLRSAVLFDVFRPKALKAGETAAPGALAQDEKSLAVRLTLGQDDSSLTDVQIEQAVQAVIEQLQQRLGARLRA
jgi:phenylalanyl-tRNA synthetase beta chain